MIRSLFLSLFFVLSLGHLCLNLPSTQINVESHLAHFSDYNNVVHDNIDDESYSPHSHSHKHSEDGQEHEHEHEHSKSLSAENKVNHSSNDNIQFLPEIDHEDGYYNREFISDSYPLGIFRPPIS